MNELISSARQIHGEFALGKDLSAGSVATALRTEADNIYTGISLNLACGIGFCAEHSAIAEMLKHREQRIAEGKSLPLCELLPHHWLATEKKP